MYTDNQQNTTVAAECIASVVCTDGYELRYRTWRTHGECAGTVILLNGLMSHSGWFQQLAAELATVGWHVVGADRRGSGLNQQARGDAASRQMLIDDLRRIVEKERRGLATYLAGWCWGAVLAVNAAFEFEDELSGLILLAPGLFPSDPIKDAARQEMSEHANENPDRACVRNPLTARMFSDREKVQAFISNDALAQRMFTPRFIHMSREMSLSAAARLHQLRLPVLTLLASCDETIDQERTLAALRRLRSVSITTLDCHHGMQFEVPQKVARSIADWIGSFEARERGAQGAH